MAKQIENKKPNLVIGRIVDRLNRPLANLLEKKTKGVSP